MGRIEQRMQNLIHIMTATQILTKFSKSYIQENGKKNARFISLSTHKKELKMEQRLQCKTEAMNLEAESR